MFDPRPIVDCIRQVHGSDEFLPLHAPRFSGNERRYVTDCIDSTFVSSVGEFVNRFEASVAEYTGARHAIAVVNGTQALFVALKLAGVDAGDTVITQSLTFVATANAISYTGAVPAFVDIDKDTLGMCPIALRRFIEDQCERKGAQLRLKSTGSPVRAVVPMHTFGHVCRIAQIRAICDEFGIELIEDAAESLGSFDGRSEEHGQLHTGRFGSIGVISFNGNKVITTGGGGILITDDDERAGRARHLTTTAKVNHPYEFIHDQIGYNFRMPNLNAALGLAQMEVLPDLLSGQAQLAQRYKEHFERLGLGRFWFHAPAGSKSNHWLNALRFQSMEDRNAFLEAANQAGVQSRAVWRPMHLLPMFRECPAGALKATETAYESIVNIPSTVPESLLPLKAA